MDCNRSRSRAGGRKFQVCPVVIQFRSWETTGQTWTFITARLCVFNRFGELARRKVEVCPVVIEFRNWETTGQTWTFSSIPDGELAMCVFNPTGMSSISGAVAGRRFDR